MIYSDIVSHDKIITCSFQDDAELRGQLQKRRVCMVEAYHTRHTRIDELCSLEKAGSWSGRRRNRPAAYFTLASHKLICSQRAWLMRASRQNFINSTDTDKFNGTCTV